MQNSQPCGQNEHSARTITGPLPVCNPPLSLFVAPPRRIRKTQSTFCWRASQRPLLAASTRTVTVRHRHHHHHAAALTIADQGPAAGPAGSPAATCRSTSWVPARAAEPATPVCAQRPQARRRSPHVPPEVTGGTPPGPPVYPAMQGQETVSAVLTPVFRTGKTRWPAPPLQPSPPQAGDGLSGNFADRPSHERHTPGIFGA